MEIASWMPVNFYKIGHNVSRFPDTSRAGQLVSVQEHPQQDVVEWGMVWSFFDSYTRLFRKSPKMIIQQWFENENSIYAECYGAKDCYLSFGVWQNAENVLYTMMSHSTITNIINSFSIVWGCDNIYSSRCITNSYNVFFSSNVHNSNNVWFSSNMLGCNDCIACSNLENMSYCIENKSYSKEEYSKLRNSFLQEKNRYDDYHYIAYRSDIDNKISTNVHGKWIVHSKDIENGFFVQNLVGWRNIFLWWWQYSGSNFYDSFDVWNQEDSHLYATNYVGENSSHVYCVIWWAQLNNVYYSYHMESCSFCLWCIWLKNKQYCIFNKQYSKEERYSKVDEIFGQMDKDGVLGEFFPASMNPFYFNDTAAYLIDPSFTKEEVTAKAYLRRDEPVKVDIPEGVDVVKVNELSNYEGFVIPTEVEGSHQQMRFLDFATLHSKWHEEVKRTIDPNILKKIIVDEKGNYYKIMKMEYDFLMKYWLPLSRKHWLERMKENFKLDYHVL